MGSWLRLLERSSQRVKGALTWGLLAAIAIADYATGPQLSAAVFYILPVAAAAWWQSRAAAYSVAVTSGIAWLLADQWEMHYAHPAIGFWNAFSRVVVFVIVLELVQAVRGLLETTRQQAETDPLTGLLNRRAFELQAEREIDRARRAHHAFAAMFIDLDNFKQVNDRHGHGRGDAVLRAVAHTMRVSLRKIDTVARLGGDEFAVLLVEIAPEEVGGVASQLRRRLLAAMAAMGAEVTFSIGVAVFVQPPADAEALLAAADRLMYKAKRGGKDAIEQAIIEPTPIPAAYT